MATSGSTDFDLTRTEIVNDAFILNGVIEQGEMPSAAPAAYAVRQLNRMLKAWQGDGVHIWTKREVYLFLVKSQARYQLGSVSGTGEHFAAVEDTIRTAIATAVVATDASIEVDSTAGMLAGDAVGVVLDDGTIEWDIIATVTDSTNLALIGTISAAAAVGNTVFTYTTKLGRPLRILDVERTDAVDQDTPIATISHREYQRLPNKTIDGLTNEVYYQPEHPDGFLYLWSRPDSAADRIRCTALFPIEDFDDTSNTPDLPQEWLDCIVWNLSGRLCPAYGVPQNTRDHILLQAAKMYEDMKGWDREPESTQMAPDFLWLE